jgi:catechol 2,3-dioxygenase-like lactoylglutathione lyase family enzyme
MLAGGHSCGMVGRSDDSGEEFYPMSLFPQLTVTDLDAAVSWYRAVGFEPVCSTSGMAHLRYTKYADVLLRTANEAVPEPRGAGVSIRVNAREPVGEIARSARERGEDVEGPTETPYNTREMRLRDPDGYELVFGEAVDPDRSFEDVVG